MNRSIFQIWCKFNLNSFLINFIFILFVYFLGLFGVDLVSCDELIKVVYNNINVRYTPTINSFRLHCSINYVLNFVLNAPDSHFKFNLYKYVQLNGKSFSYSSVYDHYHLNLYLDNMFHVHYGFTFTHNPYNLGLLPQDYKKFSDQNLFGKKRSQLILNDLRIYDLNIIKIYENNNEEKKNFIQFILDNNKNSILQFKKNLLK